MFDVVDDLRYPNRFVVDELTRDVDLLFLRVDKWIAFWVIVMMVTVDDPSVPEPGHVFGSMCTTEFLISSIQDVVLVSVDAIDVPVR